MGQALLEASSDDDVDALWTGLARTARMITNGPSAIIALGDSPVVRVIDGEAPDAAVGESLRSARCQASRRRVRHSP